jgi:hypothetical protein
MKEKEPKGVDSKTARQLFICGQVMGILERRKREEEVEPGALEAMLNQVDIGLLQAYLDSKPEGFKYTVQVQEVMKMASARN